MRRGAAVGIPPLLHRHSRRSAQACDVVSSPCASRVAMMRAWSAAAYRAWRRRA